MIRRRRLLLGLGAAALAVGGMAAIQPRRTVWPRVGGGAAPRVQGDVHVAVVGGGLAGMSAAATLAERGFRVTLYERASALGGKLSGWPITVDGRSVPMEHGFHGFFSQYYNLRSLLRAAGADRDFVAQDAYPILFRSAPPEGFGSSRLPFPVNLLEVLGRSDGIDLLDVAGDRPGMLDLLTYDPVRTFAKWDGVDVETFIREGRLEGGFADVVLRPFAQASMNALGQFSAAECIRFFHFYMLGNPEGLGFDALGRGVHESVLAPLEAHLTALGVTIRTNAEVRRVVVERGRARGVELGTLDTRRVVAGTDSTSWISVADGQAFLRRTPSGLEALDARCTHMGCPVQLTGDGFVCPCHAGRYDTDGKNVSGPPPRPLDVLRVTEDGGVVVIGAPAGSEVEPADHVIIATEGRGFRTLAAGLTPKLDAAAAATGEADPYAVARFWLDAPVDPSRASFYTVADYAWTDSIGVYSSFQIPYTEDAGRRSVVESHAYAIPSADVGTAESHAAALLAELRQAFPELARANVTHQEAMTQSNLTRFAPGDFARRPTVTTELPNLFVAGDHVQLPFPAFLMEAAVASGRLAANHIAAAHGVDEAELETVAPRGPLAG
jgi:isorenieratene synthase